MGRLEIIKPGLMTSIQDLGRKGLAYYAIPHSGVMDENAGKIANLLLNNSENAPLLECTSIAPTIKFYDKAEIAISGADFNWTLNKKGIHINQKLTISAGDILQGKFAKEGMRGYIAFKAILNIDRAFASCSTYTNAKLGGFRGRLLKKGDILYLEDIKNNAHLINIKKGPEYNWLTEASKKMLVTGEYKIKADTNRMGMRLEGYRLIAEPYQLASSAPVLPGFIQLPPSGEPIIILQDGQTTGGYPRIAYLEKSTLSKLNQIPIGKTITFTC